MTPQRCNYLGYGALARIQEATALDKVIALNNPGNKLK